MSNSSSIKNIALVIEDNPIDAEIVKSVLIGEGVVPMIVGDGYQALEALEKGSFSMILVDLLMPKMSGIEFLKRVKPLMGNLDCPIIVVSSKSEVHQVKAAIQLGAIDYLVKPVDLNLLKQKINLYSGLTTDDWYEYVLPSDSKEGISEIVFKSQLVSVNELGCTLISNMEFASQATITIRNQLFEGLGIESVVGSVMKCEPIGTRNVFRVTVVFMGLSSEVQQKIRLACRKIWTSAKTTAA